MLPGVIASGPSLQKQRFFAECAAAFDFLSTFYALPKERQEELITMLNQMQVAVAMERKQT